MEQFLFGCMGPMTYANGKIMSMKASESVGSASLPGDMSTTSETGPEILLRHNGETHDTIIVLNLGYSVLYLNYEWTVQRTSRVRVRLFYYS